MNPGRFYIPGYMGMRNFPIASSIPGMTNSIPRRMGLFGKITSGIRSVNWGGLLNGANKTLNVVNQAIPLVRQAAPMVNNMKNMLRIAKAFGTETNNKRLPNTTNNNSINTNYSKKETQDNNSIVISDNSPNFFV